MASKQKKKYYNQVFLECYIKEFTWVTHSRAGSNYAFCICCACDINIAHGGRSDLRAHESTAKHTRNATNEEKSTKISSFFSSAQSDDYSVIKAECYFTSFIVEHNLPVSVADHAGPLFRKMFPKSEEAKKYGCGRTKTTAIIGEMAGECQNKLASALKIVPFSIATDGSNDESKLYPVVVTYFDSKDSLVKNDLLAIVPLEGGATGKNIGKMLLDTLEKFCVPVKNCIALGSDNASVMTGQKNGVAAHLKQHNENIIVLGCACHLLHLAAEKGSTGLCVNVEEILLDVYYYLEKSAKRKEKLKELQTLCDKKSKKVLKHVCTRWLSLGVCLSRVVELWQPLTWFYKEEVDSKVASPTESLSLYKIPKSLSSKCANKISSADTSATKDEATVCATTSFNKCSQDKDTNVGLPCKGKSSFKRTSVSHDFVATKKVKKPLEEENHIANLSRQERVFMFLTADLNKCICYFLLHVIPVFDKANIILQSQAPHVHILRSLLTDMLKELLVKFVKPSVIKTTPVLDIKYNIATNQKSDEDVLVGCNASRIVATLTDTDRAKFYTSVRNFFKLSCDYIVLKFPLENEILKHAEVANVKNIENASFKSVKFFIDKFPTFLLIKDRETSEEALDLLQEQFCVLQADSDIAFEPLQRMDSVWSSISKIECPGGGLKYDRVAYAMLSILIIPHSNAECERVFSSVRKNRTTYRSSMSDNVLNNILLAKSADKMCYEQEFDVPFLKKAKSATHLALQKKD